MAPIQKANQTVSRAGASQFPKPKAGPDDFFGSGKVFDDRRRHRRIINECDESLAVPLADGFRRWMGIRVSGDLRIRPLANHSSRVKGANALGLRRGESLSGAIFRTNYQATWN